MRSTLLGMGILAIIVLTIAHSLVQRGLSAL